MTDQNSEFTMDDYIELCAAIGTFKALANKEKSDALREYFMRHANNAESVVRKLSLVVARAALAEREAT